MPRSFAAEIISANDGAAVSPSDSTAILATRGIWVGGAGTLVVTMAKGGNNLTFVGVQAGTLLPISVTKVLSTGTTATSILALR